MSHLNIYVPDSMAAVVTDTDILGFFGEYRWLSNFWPVDIAIDRKNKTYIFTSTEAAYQAHKSKDDQDWEALTKMSAGQAKRFGNTITLREDWDSCKYNVMLKLTRKKFEHPILKQKLLDTGNRYLEETNNWGDTYWGVCDSIGLNNLGHILMQVRNGIN